MKWISIAAILSMSACAIKQDPHSAEFFITSASTLSAEVSPLQSFGVYQVHLKWKPIDGASSIAIKRIDDSGRAIQLDLLPGSATEYVDQTARHKMNYVYRVAPVTADAGLVEGEPVEVITPTDLLIDHDQVLSNIEAATIHRLFLGNKVRASTLGREVSIDVDELISEDATISTLPESETALSGLPGLSAGLLTIHARTARGGLFISARGQNGGEGNRGANGNRGTDGSKGSGAKTGNSQACLSRTPLDGILDVLRSGDGCTQVTCVSGPSNGTPGGQGTPGQDGFEGLPGGDSAKVSVTVDTPDQFQIHYERFAGLGGRGGPGGDGGEGGQGGLAGDTKYPCGDASAGAPGPRGNQGKTGPTGPTGNLQPICIHLGTSILGECEK